MKLCAFPPTVHWRGPDGSHVASWRDGTETVPLLGLISTRPSTSSGSTPAYVVSESSLLTQLYILCSIAIKAKGEVSDRDLVAHWDMIWLGVCSGVSNMWLHHKSLLSSQLCVNCSANNRVAKKALDPDRHGHGFLFSFEMANLNTDVQIDTPLAASCLLLTFT